MAARLNAEERQAARNARTRTRRQAFYAAEMQSATTVQERLAIACRFLRAACAGLPDAEVSVVAAAVVGLAEERNPT